LIHPPRRGGQKQVERAIFPAFRWIALYVTSHVKTFPAARVVDGLFPVILAVTSKLITSKNWALG